MTNERRAPAPGYLSADDCRLADLIDLVSQKTDLADYPYAERGRAERAHLRQRAAAEGARRPGGPAGGRGRAGPRPARRARASWCWPARSMTRGSSTGPPRQFEAIIAAQRAAGGAVGDHFAAAGQNDRIWNALEKLALRAPEVFADYYANDLIATVCRAWLGPGYQVTSQVNVVNPGGAAQTAHRDYHLGFRPATQAARFPAHVHRLSPVLTLQGAVAHYGHARRDRPDACTCRTRRSTCPATWPGGGRSSGSTSRRTTCSCRWPRATRCSSTRPLFHAAGANRTADVRRMANLLQVSSAFGRAMEAVDRTAMSVAVFPALQAMADDGASPAAIANVIAACAEGYAFPTNLDLDQPVGGLAPPTQADILSRAVAEGWSRQQLETELEHGRPRQTRRPS